VQRRAQLVTVQSDVLLAVAAFTMVGVSQLAGVAQVAVATNYYWKQLAGKLPAWLVTQRPSRAAYNQQVAAELSGSAELRAWQGVDQCSSARRGVSQCFWCCRS